MNAEGGIHHQLKVKALCRTTGQQQQNAIVARLQNIFTKTQKNGT